MRLAPPGPAADGGQAERAGCRAGVAFPTYPRLAETRSRRVPRVMALLPCGPIPSAVVSEMGGPGISGTRRALVISGSAPQPAQHGHRRRGTGAVAEFANAAVS